MDEPSHSKAVIALLMLQIDILSLIPRRLAGDMCMTFCLLRAERRASKPRVRLAQRAETVETERAGCLSSPWLRDTIFGDQHRALREKNDVHISSRKRIASAPVSA